MTQAFDTEEARKKTMYQLMVIAIQYTYTVII